MADRKNASDPGSVATSTAAGVLRPDQLAQHASVERMACAPALAAWVENYWLLRWDLPAGASYLSSTLPHPACTLSVERGHQRDGVGADPVVVTGVLTHRFDVTVREWGWVLGVKFRPGGMAGLTGVDAGRLRDATVPATEVFDAATVDALRTLGPDLTRSSSAPASTPRSAPSPPTRTPTTPRCSR